MDPLRSVAEFREQQGSGSRVVKIAPPPPPVMPIPAPAVTTAEVRESELDDTGELDLTMLNDTDTADAAENDQETERGIVRGRKRVVQVYLPAPTRALLDAGREVHGTFGTAAMVALRGSYQWLVDTYTPEPVEAVGPFPAPRTTRRRLGVEDARMQQLLVDPAEASGIETLADQLEMSLSELVTLAIDKFYEDATTATPTKTRTRT